LPEIGALQVAGKNLGDVQHLVQSALRTQFRDVEADISLAEFVQFESMSWHVVSPARDTDISSLSTHSMRIRRRRRPLMARCAT